MVNLHENFYPVRPYARYLALSTSIVIDLIILGCTAWIPFIFLGVNPPLFGPSWLVVAALVVGGTVWVCIWAHLYYKTVVYHMNDTEIIWKRGVLFRQTGIVPYNRITNVDIVQGPIMRIFGVHNLKIDTAAGSSSPKAEIRLEGMDDPEPLRALIMSYVRGTAPSAGAVGAGYVPETQAAPDMQALIAEVRAIRTMLESQKK